MANKKEAEKEHIEHLEKLLKKISNDDLRKNIQEKLRLLKGKKPVTK